MGEGNRGVRRREGVKRLGCKVRAKRPTKQQGEGGEVGGMGVDGKAKQGQKEE